MDANDVGRLTPSHAVSGPRRRLLGAALAGLLTGVGRQMAGAEKHPRNKKRSRKKQGDDASSGCNVECVGLSCARCEPEIVR